jgi:hypothetical protein
MKTKHLVTIATLFGLSLVPALPSHSQSSNPCKLAPHVTPSRETRQIRVEKYGIGFNIPENYRTRSNIKGNYMNILIYNPSSFDYTECLRNNNIGGDDYYFSSEIIISPTQASISLIDIAGEIYRNRQISNLSKLTIANQPSITFNYGYNASGVYYLENLNSLLLLPSKKYSVLISIPLVFDPKVIPLVFRAKDGNALGETIKSSFTFDMSSSADSKAVDNDDLITVVQTKACQLLNQGSSISDVVSNVKPTVKKLDQEYLFIHANLSRKMHSESGNDVDIVTRRMIGGAIKRDCPQFQNKLTEYYKSNFSSNSQPVNSNPETSVRPSNANPPQPPLRLNNQKLEPESPKILLSANISSSEAQVLEKLNSVPVFTITDATGKPLFGKNDTNSPQVLFFFLNPDDATAYLNWIKNTNPELSQNARIIARSLTEAYQTIKKNQDRKDITFQITPSKSSLDSAREILPSQAKFANKLPNIPVFFATGNANGTNGLLTLTIDGKQTVPYFFDLKDLQSLLNKAMQAQPNVSNSTKIQVTSLYYVLDLMVDAKNGKPNPETERFEFVPSRSAFEYAVQKGSSK